MRLNESSRYCHDDCPSVCLSGTGLQCYHPVHFSTDLNLWLNSEMFRAPRHQSMSTYSRPSLSTSTWKRGGVWMQDYSYAHLIVWVIIEVLSQYSRKQNYLLSDLLIYCFLSSACFIYGEGQSPSLFI